MSKALTIRGTRELLFARKDEFTAALAGRVDADVFLRIAHQAVTRNPKLLECTPESLLMALSESASLGLLPTGVLGEAYLVPQRNKGVWQVEFRPGFRGLITLCRRSGGVVNIVPATIHSGEYFEIRLGDERRLIHRPELDSAKRGDPIVYYAVATLPGGGREFWYKTKEGVDAIRKRSRTPDDGPWRTDYEPMAWKTVIREFVKYLPMDTHEIARALDADGGDFDLSNPAAHSAVRDLNTALGDEPEIQEAEVIEEAEFTDAPLSEAEEYELAMQAKEAGAAA